MSGVKLDHQLHYERQDYDHDHPFLNWTTLSSGGDICAIEFPDRLNSLRSVVDSTQLIFCDETLDTTGQDDVIEDQGTI